MNHMQPETIVKKMFTALKDSLGEEYDRAETQVNSILKTKEARLKNLSEKRLHGEISGQEFQSYIEDEKDMLIIELNTLQVIGKASAQRAVNAALGVFNDAINKALKAL
ncbi:MAG: hypothetical protein ACLFM1_11300 [Bacteroidales bacterium]